MWLGGSGFLIYWNNNNYVPYLSWVFLILLRFYIFQANLKDKWLLSYQVGEHMVRPLAPMIYRNVAETVYSPDWHLIHSNYLIAPTWLQLRTEERWARQWAEVDMSDTKQWSREICMITKLPTGWRRENISCPILYFRCTSTSQSTLSTPVA